MMRQHPIGAMILLFLLLLLYQPQLAESIPESLKFDILWSGGVPNPFCTSECPNVTATDFKCSSDADWNGIIHFKYNPLPSLFFSLILMFCQNRDPLGSLFLVTSINITLVGHFNCQNASSPV